MKLPAIQFYPGDWRKDPGVQCLSFHDKGVWFEILLLMHESHQRGKLLLNGKKMPDDSLARLLGLDKQSLTNTLTTLLTSGVASRDEATGALMSRRMVRDEEIRKMRKNIGKLGGNPKLLLNQPPNQNTEDEDEVVIEDSLKVFNEIERRIAKIFNRPVNTRSGYVEQSALSEISRRPDALKELVEIEVFQKKTDNWFPQSVQKLLSTWQDTLDRARTHEERKKSISPKALVKSQLKPDHEKGF